MIFQKTSDCSSNRQMGGDATRRSKCAFTALIRAQEKKRCGKKKVGTM